MTIKIKKTWGRVSAWTSTILVTLGTVASLAPAVLGNVANALPASTTVYNALPKTSTPTNVASLGFEATQTSEFGDEVHLGGTNRVLNQVTVAFSNWAKRSDWSTYSANGSNNSYYVEPVTVNVYADQIGADGAPTSLLEQKVVDVHVPWRPESDATCPDKGYGAGFAWRDSSGTCDNGLAFTQTFNFNDSSVVLPDDVIIGVAFNTEGYGANPTGVDGPYDSLNVAIPDNQSVTVGKDVSTDQVFWKTATGSYYSIPGATNVFREDTNWTPNGTVALQIKASPVTITGVQMLDNTQNNYAPVAPGLITKYQDPTQFDLTWNAVPTADHYITTVYRNGKQVGTSGWTGTPNSWVSSDGFAKYGDGSYTFSIAAYSATGLLGTTTTGAYVYDTTAPKTSILTPLLPTVKGTVTVSSLVSDEHLNVTALGLENENHQFTPVDGVTGDTIWFYNNNNGLLVHEQWDTTKVSDGTYYIWLQASDYAGNYSQPVEKKVVVDNTTPVINPITFTDRDGNVQNLTTSTVLGGKVTFHASQTELHPGSLNVEYDKLVSGAWKKESTSSLTGGLGKNSVDLTVNTAKAGDGEYRVVVSSVDAVGNKATDVVTTFTVDNTAPTITPTNYVGDLSTKTFSQVSFGFYDQYKVSKFSLNGVTGTVSPAVWSNYDFTNLAKYFGLTDGSNVFKLYDVAGNVQEYDFTFDSVAPSLHIDDSAVLAGTKPTITGTTSTSDADRAVLVTVDGVQYTATVNSDGTWSVALPTELSANTYTVSATSTDDAGNVGTATGTLTVSTIPPVNLNLPAPQGTTPTGSNQNGGTGTTGGNNDGTPAEDTSTPGVLGDQTNTPNTDDLKTTNAKSDEGVKGESTTKDSVAWVWWIVIAAAVVAALWWVIAAWRRRADA